MNKEEVKFDHFKDIEELIKHLEMWYAEDDYFAYERYFHLRDARIMGMFIYELQQENQKYKEVIDKLKEWINIVQQNKDNKHLEPFISTDELDELLDILNEVEI